MGKVYIGLSGGVDSAVAAYLLLKEGYDVQGVFLETWHPSYPPCTEGEDRLSAMRVAAHLGIPFTTLDATDEYKSFVTEAFISEYRKGRTPNPDMTCNAAIKFGFFYEYARAHGAKLVATGHYARLPKEDGRTYLLKAKDNAKDQSYFLASVNQDRLSDALFPLGEYVKDDVRHLASEIRLPNAGRKDSQGICMLGNISMTDFLHERIGRRKGAVYNESGEVIGHHEGALTFTIGQRHGFTVTKKEDHDGPWYVIEKDVNQNSITVGKNELTRPYAEYLLGSVVLHDVISESEEYIGLLRYHGRNYRSHVHIKNNLYSLSITEVHTVPAIGQYAVLYYGDRVVMSGTIESYL